MSWTAKVTMSNFTHKINNCNKNMMLCNSQKFPNYYTIKITILTLCANTKYSNT